MPAKKSLTNKAILTLFLASASTPYMIPCTLAADTGAQPQISQDVAESYQKVQDYTFDKRYKLVDWANFRQTAINYQIGNFERRMGQVPNVPFKEYSAAITDIRQKQEALQQKINALQSSSAGAWDNAKQDFVNAAEALEQAYYDAVARFETHHSQS